MPVDTAKGDRVVSWATFRRFQKRATVAFVMLTLAAVGSSYLSWHAGQESDHAQDVFNAELSARAQDAIVSSCVQRARGRGDIYDSQVALVEAALVHPPKTARQEHFTSLFLKREAKALNPLIRPEKCVGAQPPYPRPLTKGGRVPVPHGPPPRLRAPKHKVR